MEIKRKLADEVIRRVVAHASLTIQDWEELHKVCGGLNSYDRQFLVPYMGMELIAHQIRHTLKNCGHIPDPPRTYEEALQPYAERAAQLLEYTAEYFKSTGIKPPTRSKE